MARLKTPVRLAEQSWQQDDPAPLVSILCITYQHEKFISAAIESFLMQETTFPVEIFVHDDASRDGTPNIVKEYHKRYPQLLQIVLQDENQWSKGGFNFFFDLLKKQRGKYIALCEGDDYWTSPHKLERQVKMLEMHPDALISFHAHKEVDEEGVELPYKSSKTSATGLLPRGAYLKGMCESWQTASIVMRRELVDCLPNWVQELPFGDVSLMSLASIRGPLHSLPETYSCHRNHKGGMFSEKRLGGDEIVKLRKSIFWDNSLVRLLILLETEAQQEEIRKECRRKAIKCIEDLIWQCRMLPDRRQMRRYILRALRLDPVGVILSKKILKNALIAFTGIPDFNH